MIVHMVETKLRIVQLFCDIPESQTVLPIIVRFTGWPPTSGKTICNGGRVIE